MGFLGVFIFLLSLAEALGECNDPPVIPNAVNDLDGAAPYAAGTRAIYTCNIGYTESGYSSVYTCEAGAWKGSFECLEILCTFLDAPRHGYISNNPTYKINSLLKFACDDGYNINGGDVLRCTIDNWSPSDEVPTCVPKNCGEFGEVLNGRVFQEAPDGVSNDFGSVVTVSCEDGYTLSGGGSVYCQADGTWGPKPQCVASQCPDYPGLNYTKCIENSVVSSKILYLICKDDPDLVTKVGDETATICMNSKWQDLSLRCFCNCECKPDLSSVVYGNCNAKGYLPHGSSLSWQCEAGSHKNGNQPISCFDGTLSTEPVCVPNPTTTPKPVLPTDGTGSSPIPPGPLPHSGFDDVHIIVIIVVLVLLAILTGLGLWRYKGWLNAQPHQAKLSCGEKVKLFCSYGLCVESCLSEEIIRRFAGTEEGDGMKPLNTAEA